MTQRNPEQPEQPQQPDQPEQADRLDRRRPLSQSTGLTLLSYMLGGMILYGGIGWLIGRWTHLPVLFGLGMLVGLVLSVALIIFRVTRS